MQMEPMTIEKLQRQAMMKAVWLVSSDGTVKILHDCPKLHAVCARLRAKGNNKNLDLIIWWQIKGVLGLLNLHLNKGAKMSWKEASMLILMAQGHKETHARCLYE